MPLPTAVALPPYRSYWDGAGALLSTLCLLHCLTLPLLSLVLPALAWASDERVHQVLAVTLIFPVAAALWSSRRRHRHSWPLAIGVTSLIVVAIAAYAELSESAETALTVLGSLGLIGAHGWNFALCRSCPACQCEQSRAVDDGGPAGMAE